MSSGDKRLAEDGVAAKFAKLDDGNKNGHNEFSAPNNGKQVSTNEMASVQLHLSDMSPKELLEFVNSQIVGRSLIFDTVFGPKLKLYADYTASGQELHFVIDLMTRIGEYYANTHNEMSATGTYINQLLKEAQACILKTMQGSDEDYFVLGLGSGSTYAMEMAQKFLGTYFPPATRDQMLKLFPPGTTLQDLKAQLRSKNQLPIVLISHYEHHSNEVTWRNQLCDVIECQPATKDGQIDLKHLEALLKENAGGRRVIGSFSAGSNVTGLKTDVFAVASLLKKYGALAFFDYAAVGPYVPIDLSRKTEDGRCLIDGIFLSPHKFIGGPGSCGILVFNRRLYEETAGKDDPTHGGGGTVEFVWQDGQLFKGDPTQREKSGTTGILQTIKAGLVFQLKSLLQPIIEERERKNLERFYEAVGSMKNLQLLGPQIGDFNKIVIMSFMIYHDGPNGRRYLHQDFVVRLLNDLFGIQARGGCSCACPYGLYLLDIDAEKADRIRFWIEPHPSLGDNVQLAGFKIGWARLTLHFTMTDYELDYLLFALGYLCEHGHRFLPSYKFNPVNGQWRHISEAKQSVSGPLFGFDALSGEKRHYVEPGEGSRREVFDRQRSEALALLDKLPESKELDPISEMPLAYFYVEKSMLLERNQILAKSKAYEKHYH